MSDYLSELAEELAIQDSLRPRARQNHIGASGVYACRAALVLRRNGVVPGRHDFNWKAAVGTAIHKVVERTRRAHHPDHVIEKSNTYAYRGVKCGPDEYDPREGGTYRDVKTKDTAGEILRIKTKGPDRRHIGQAMLNAAALIEAGHEVSHVELAYLPRAGDLRDGYVWRAKFDRALADEAATWIGEVEALAVERANLSIPKMVEGIRDEYPSFCEEFCPFVRQCRGPALTSPPVDDYVAEKALEFVQLKRQAEELDKRLDALKGQLARYREVQVTPKLRIAWQGGREKQDIDIDKVLEDYRFVIGEPPTKTVTTRRSLRIWETK